MNNVKDIRDHFKMLYNSKIFSNKEKNLIEIINASFIADQPTIFGNVNKEYADKELLWYLSKSTSINNMEKPVPEIWRKIAGKNGYINSNYGFLMFDPSNYMQFPNAIKTLVENPNSRRATMIYNRPNMHYDYKFKGANDFICTMFVQLFIRRRMLHYLVYMRSNDAIYGYKYDLLWHQYLHEKAVNVLSSNLNYRIKKGDLIWNAASLHIYKKHFKFLKEMK